MLTNARFSLVGIMVLALSIARAQTRPDEPATGRVDCLPATWDTNQMVPAEIPDEPVPPRSLVPSVLTWLTRVDDTGRSEEWVLVAAAGRDAKKKKHWRWYIISRDPGVRPDWHVVMAHGKQGSRRAWGVSDRPPTNAVLEPFLADWWPRGPITGWRLVTSAVCDERWRAITGERPPPTLQEKGG